MSKFQAPVALDAFKSRYAEFQDLMSRRVQNILLVSNLYDSFILEQDGALNEMLLSEFLDLNLRHTPGLTRVSSGSEALDKLRENPERFNLVITGLTVGDMDAQALARKIHDAGAPLPVVLLGYDARRLREFVSTHEVEPIDRAFLWQGDVRILLAIVKYIEDKLNVEEDARRAGVQVIILIEDSIRYYSSFLPLIYAELLRHSQSLISEGVNLTHKILRMRARPKIILCSDYEEAWTYFSRYEKDILGVISDVEFPRNGRLDPEAGIAFAQEVKQAWPDVPVLLHSDRVDNEPGARRAGATFIRKGSPTLLNELRQFMVENFSFGDFVFRMPDGKPVARAHNLRTLVEKLRSVPEGSITFHAARNHFSNWLKARTEFALAHELRPRRISDFPSVEALRRDLIHAIETYRRESQQGIIADFSPHTFDPTSGFARLGGGSIGGKARGLAFVRYVLNNYPISKLYDDVRVFVPPAVVLATDVFDRFLQENGLREIAIHAQDDEEISRRFMEAPLPGDVRNDLSEFLKLVDSPIAVRSSSLLEDSQFQPFTGVYETYMLSNDADDHEVRLQQLVTAIKRVYASTFSQRAKAYLRATPYRLEEEKMAVIVMKVVGARHGTRFYPSFSGVARSHNFYPSPPLDAEDGVAAVALGLGRTVVEGGTCLRFSPRYPRHVLQFSSVKDVLDSSQRTFWALPLDGEEAKTLSGDPMREAEYELERAERDGTLNPVGSTYSPENDVVYDGLSRPGIRLVSFAPVLKHGLFPLAEVLQTLLELGSWGVNAPVEIEFAVNLDVPRGEKREFGFLQMRPLALTRESEELEIDHVPREQLICESDRVLGNGRVEVRDLVVVDYHRFERAQSQEVALGVARFNAKLSGEGLPYALIGVGRWGSKDPWLGIPVTWEQIAGARAIVESGFRDFTVTPSQGTHFFQNLTSFMVGYFTVNSRLGEGFLDWEWLGSVEAVEESAGVRRLRFDRPVVIKMNGRSGEGVIMKPGVEAETAHESDI
jgi:CheY-like chemotaxis protein